jgi:acylphosphatase
MKLHAIVKGRVQGVGFRFWAQRHAGELGLDGWVKNLPDRAVEVTAFGPPGVLDEFEQLLRQGPPGAYVQSVAATRSEGAGDGEGFRIECG